MQSLSVLALIFLSAALNVAAQETETDTEARSIIGGRDAPRHPFYVFLLLKESYSDGAFQCGGTILSKNVVVTAAHCLYLHRLGRWASLGELTVITSDFTDPSWDRTGTEYGVEKGDIMQGYDPRDAGSKNDIAVLVIRGRFNMRYNKALPICPSGRRYNKARAIGMGKISQSPDRLPKVLQEADLYQDPKCQSWGHYTNYKMQLCYSDPGRKSVCQGDSGGPLVGNFGKRSQCLLGVVSFGDSERCDHPIRPAVFTRASYYRNWIQSLMN